MTIITHTVDEVRIAEVIADHIIIKNGEDALQLLGDLYYQGFDGLILSERIIIPEFFELRNGMAGEILQKFSNYRMRLAIIGDFSKFQGKSIADFIYGIPVNITRH